jgi:Zn ribbon nucleic-acid-binding protein
VPGITETIIEAACPSCHHDTTFSILTNHQTGTRMSECGRCGWCMDGSPRCTKHRGFEADYCPVCGTAAVIGGAL